jgi:hypothetical protein
VDNRAASLVGVADPIKESARQEPEHDAEHPAEHLLRVHLQRCGVPIAAGALYPWFGLLPSPMIASTAMTFSSVFRDR